MGRILGIDYGTKRVGLAVSDPLKLIAGPLAVVHPKDLMAWLKDYFAKETVEAACIGMPKNLDNLATNNTQHVVGFVRLFRKTFPHIPLHEVDERFTSVVAHQTMRAAGLGKKDRQDKETVDQVSAILILQGYMQG